MNADPKQRTAAAHRVVLGAMGELAWPTIILACLLIVGQVVTLIGAAMGWVPVWLAFLIITGIVYASYTVVHEAVHGSIARQNAKMRWLNEALGVICGTLIGAPLTAHRKEHLDHHRHTNTEEDPDLKLVGGGLWRVLPGMLHALPHQIIHYMNRHWVKASGKDRFMLGFEIFLLIAWRHVYFVWAGWEMGLLLTVLANFAGILIVLIFFAWIVHWPHTQVGRYKDTATFVFPRPIDMLISWLWLFQNYHSVHHLYPRVPFYRYRQVFRGIESDMKTHDAPIIRVGGK